MTEDVIGRESELEILDRFLDSLETGFRALLLFGEPGIGKTTVWREGLAEAQERGYRTLACSPVEAETRLSYAALGDLLEPGRPALLLFTSPTCGPCTHLVPSVAAWQREHADELTIALLSTGAPDAVRAEAAEHGLVCFDPQLGRLRPYLGSGLNSRAAGLSEWAVPGSNQ